MQMMGGTDERRRWDWRVVVGGIGRTLIGAGLLLLAFVAYQLWGTGLQTARAQQRLEREFAEQLATASTVPPAPTTTRPTGPATTVAPTTAPPTTVPVPLEIQEGDAIARLEIPRIGVDDIVVAGVKVADLRRGPGHYPDTPLPGQQGNAAIAGHRTTYGAPFFRVDELEPGDEIAVTTLQGRFVYRVTGQRIVSPSDLSVLAPTDEPTLTLTSCHPRYSARQRIIITARLDEAASSPVQAATPAYGSTAASVEESGGEDETGVLVTTTVAPGVAVTTTPTVPAPAAADAFDRGWFSDPSAWPPTLLTGLLTVLVGVGAWWAARRWSRWLYVPAAPVFAVALFVFFEQFSRLLPPNI